MEVEKIKGDAIVRESAGEFYESQLHRIWRRFLHHHLAVVGGCVILVLFLSTVFAALISPHDPLDLDTQRRFIAPFTDSNYILGTDEMGRGTLTRLIYGGRISLIVGVTAMFATIVTGMIVGLLSGYYGGRVDNILMRFTDTMLCFPQVFLLLVLAAFITPTVISIALIIGFTSWMEVAYISFLGYGIQPPLASWGNMLTDAQAYFDLAPWLAILPGLMITLTVMSFNFLGDGLRDALDPRLRMMSG